MKTALSLLILLGMLLGACVPAQNGPAATAGVTVGVSTVMPGTLPPLGTQGPASTPVPPTPIPTLPSGSSPTELKYALLEYFPDFFYCDPDYYPVARADETTLALQRFPEILADQEQFQAILEHNGLTGLTTFTDEQKLLIYRDYKKLAALDLELSGGKYQFQLQTGAEGQSGYVITGTIDGQGNIDVQQRTPSVPTCPICLAAGSRIDTPLGAIPVEDLHIGDPVWTAGPNGERLPATILRVTRVPVPINQRMVHIVLADGRELLASLGHPTADGRTMATLSTGDMLDGGRVLLAEQVPYAGAATYDILPSGGSGFYWVNGILMGSTLAQP
jgi:hypothetical protein